MSRLSPHANTRSKQRKRGGAKITRVHPVGLFQTDPPLSAEKEHSVSPPRGTHTPPQNALQRRKSDAAINSATEPRLKLQQPFETKLHTLQEHITALKGSFDLHKASVGSNADADGYFAKYQQEKDRARTFYRALKRTEMKLEEIQREGWETPSVQWGQNEITDALAESLGENRNLQQENARLKAELVHYKEKCQGIEVKELQAICHQFSTEIEEKTEEINQLQIRNQQVNTWYQELLDNLDAQRDRMRRECTGCIEQSTWKIENDYKSINRKVDICNEELDKLFEIAERIKDSRGTTAQSEVKSLKSGIAQLEIRHKNLLEKKNLDTDKLERELSEEKGKNTQLETIIKETKAKIEVWTNTEIKRIEEESQEMTARNLKLRKIISQRDTEIGHLREETKKLNEETSDADKMCNKLREEKNQLTKCIENYEYRENEHQNEIELDRESTKKIQEELVNLDHLKSSKNRLEEENRTLTGKLQQSESSKQELARKLELQEQVQKQLMEDKETAFRENQRALEQSQQEKSSIEQNAQNELKRAKDTHKDSTRELEGKEHEIRLLKDRISQSLNDSAVLAEFIEKLTTQVKEKDEELKTLNGALHEYKTESSILNQETNSLKEKLNSACQEIASRSTEHSERESDLANRISDLTNELSGSLETLNREKASSEQTINSLTKQIETLKDSEISAESVRITENALKKELLDLGQKQKDYESIIREQQESQEKTQRDSEEAIRELKEHLASNTKLTEELNSLLKHKTDEISALKSSLTQSRELLKTTQLTHDSFIASKEAQLTQLTQELSSTEQHKQAEAASLKSLKCAHDSLQSSAATEISSLQSQNSSLECSLTQLHLSLQEKDFQISSLEQRLDEFLLKPSSLNTSDIQSYKQLEEEFISLSEENVLLKYQLQELSNRLRNNETLYENYQSEINQLQEDKELNRDTYNEFILKLEQQTSLLQTERNKDLLHSQALQQELSALQKKLQCQEDNQRAMESRLYATETAYGEAKAHFYSEQDLKDLVIEQLQTEIEASKRR